MAVEEPVFGSVVQDRAFEIRDYPALVVAEVTVTGEQKEAARKGFRLLAAYIFGSKRRKQGLAMTAPVTQETAGEKIAMTAPVTQTQTAGEWVVRFTMPRSYSLETLPQPNGARVRLRVMPPARFAVIRFSGLAQPDDVAAKIVELSEWMQRRHLRRAGPASLAQYNPPWTLWFMRRNEVMIPIEFWRSVTATFPSQVMPLILADIGGSYGQPYFSDGAEEFPPDAQSVSFARQSLKIAKDLVIMHPIDHD